MQSHDALHKDHAPASHATASAEVPRYMQSHDALHKDHAPASHATASSEVPRYMQSHEALHKDHASAPHAAAAPASHHSAVSVESGPFHKPAPAAVTRQDIPTKGYMH